MLGGAPACYSLSPTPGEGVLATSPSPDGTFLAVWTTRYLHVCTTTGAAIESVSRIDVRSVGDGGDDLALAIWRPAAVVEPGAGNREHRIVLVSRTQLVVVAFTERMEKKSTWVRWLLGEEDVEEDERDPYRAPLSFELVHRFSVTAAAGAQFTAAAGTRSGLIVGRDDGVVALLSWDGEVKFETPFADGLPSGEAPSTGALYATHVAAAGSVVLAACSNGGVYAVLVPLLPALVEQRKASTLGAVGGGSSGHGGALPAPPLHSGAALCIVMPQTIGAVLPPCTALAATSASPYSSSSACPHTIFISLGRGDGRTEVYVLVRSGGSGGDCEPPTEDGGVPPLPHGPPPSWRSVLASMVLPPPPHDDDGAMRSPPRAGALLVNSSSQYAAPAAGTGGASVSGLAWRSTSGGGGGSAVDDTSPTIVLAVLLSGAASSPPPAVAERACLWEFSRCALVGEAAERDDETVTGRALGGSASSVHAAGGGGSSSGSNGGATLRHVVPLPPSSPSCIATAALSQHSKAAVIVVAAAAAAVRGGSLRAPRGRSGASRLAWTARGYSLLVGVAPPPPPAAAVVQAEGVENAGPRSAHLVRIQLADAAGGARRSASHCLSEAGALLLCSEGLLVLGGGRPHQRVTAASSPHEGAAIRHHHPTNGPLGWLPVPGSQYFVPANSPLKRVTSTHDGAFAAVAGDRGVATYDLRRSAWHVFSTPRQEQGVAPVAMAWLGNRALLVLHRSDADAPSAPHHHSGGGNLLGPASKGRAAATVISLGLPRSSSDADDTSPDSLCELQAYARNRLDALHKLGSLQLSLPRGSTVLAMATGTTTVRIPSPAAQGHVAASSAPAVPFEGGGSYPTGAVVHWTALAFQDRRNHSLSIALFRTRLASSTGSEGTPAPSSAAAAAARSTPTTRGAAAPFPAADRAGSPSLPPGVSLVVEGQAIRPMDVEEAAAGRGGGEAGPTFSSRHGAATAAASAWLQRGGVVTPALAGPAEVAAAAFTLQREAAAAASSSSSSPSSGEEDAGPAVSSARGAKDELAQALTGGVVVVAGAATPPQVRSIEAGATGSIALVVDAANAAVSITSASSSAVSGGTAGVREHAGRRLPPPAPSSLKPL